MNFLGFTTFGFNDNFNNEKLQDGINILEDLQKSKITETLEDHENPNQNNKVNSSKLER